MKSQDMAAVGTSNKNKQFGCHTKLFPDEFKDVTKFRGFFSHFFEKL